ncbi:MAG: shikimate dehydrogenase [Nitrospirae bacterium]|nr:shikimate dehydrogenase [Nitrospirota bacterium]
MTTWSRSAPTPPRVTGTTRVVALLGDPVGHSRSPQMHNAAFAALGLNYCYVPFPVRSSALRPAIRGLVALGVVGANVTIPHKERVVPYLDELSIEARLIGAVNTIHLYEGRLVGYNTDARGFLRAFREDTGVSVRGGRFLVLGAGGAARAVVVALALGGARAVTIANRSVPKARQLVRRFRRLFPSLDWSVVTSFRALPPSRTFRGVVQATSVGMRSDDPSPLPVEWLNRSLVVYDLVYSGPTMLLKAAEDVGARHAGGLGMLVHQGALAFTIWTARRAPVDVMRRALIG